MVKSIIYISACILCIFVTAKAGIHIATGATLLYLCMGYYLGRRIDYYFEMKHYENIRGNIYEGHQSPEDKEVIQRANEHKRKLKESGNPLYNYETGPQIDVEICLFRDHLHPRESWEEYLERREEYECKADQVLALKLYKNNNGWYEGIIMGQVGAYRVPSVEDIDYIEV